LYSSDGKEYITPEHLESEILCLVNDNGGRLGLHDICSHLSVNFDVVEHAANRIVAKTELKVSNGSLMTPHYCDTVVEEIAEILTDQGFLAISDPSNKHGIPMDFLKKTILDRMHMLPEGSQFNGNIL
jgi:E3 UFM1-protein ligase 1